MSRLLRIIIFIIIVLLLIFFGFRCSQTIPNGSKATANFIEKNQPEKDNAPSANSDEAVENDVNKTPKATLPISETSKNTADQNNTSNDKKTASDNNAELVQAAENNSQPATTEQTKLDNKKNRDTDTTTNNEAQERVKADEDKNEEEKGNTDKTTNTDTAAITAGASIVLKGVSFASGSDKLISSSIIILNEVAKTLKEKPTLHIEIAGYTDNQGNPAANTKLSQLRADQVKAHLVTQDITTERISTKGYGSDSPIANNKTETGRKQNRRVEIHVK